MILNMKKLYLSECKDTNIDISIPVKLDKELYKHNASDEYYNNKCLVTTSNSGTDICLKDRRNEFIEHNLTLCENNCILIDYNYTTYRAKCNCKLKVKLSIINDIKFDKNKLLKSFTDVKGFFTNIDVVKCYKSVFKKKVIVNNIGFFISLFILVLLVICIILFYAKFFKILKMQIHIISKAIKFKYINKKVCFKKCTRKDKKNSNNNFISKSKISVKKTIKLNNKEMTTSGNKKASYNLIKILSYNDTEKNELTYEKALIHDKRTFLQYYYSLLKIKNLFLFSFFPNKDYNLPLIKIFLFFFSFFTQLTINALYFTDDTMHKIYIDKGKFDFIYNIPQIIFSSLISYNIDFLISYLSLSEKDVLRIKNMKIKKKKNIKEKVSAVLSKLSLKFGFFFPFSFTIVLIFGFYVVCFCGVYKNTQINLITDTGFSFCLTLITPFIVCLLPAILRIVSLKANDKKGKIMYKIATYLEII